MKHIAFIGVFVMTLLMSSCDYWGDFIFVVKNKTNQDVVVSYYEQLRSTEDVLPTYEHGDDYPWVHLAETPTVVTIKPDSTFERIYDIGPVNAYWPEEEDTPERWHIVPLWSRIDYIVVGTDTLAASEYAKEKWDTKNGCVFTLVIR